MRLFSKHASRLVQRWTYDTNTGLLRRPVTDGKRIVLGTKDGRIICINRKGEELWTFRADENLSEEESYFVDEEHVHSFSSPPVLADVNHDKRPEVLAGTELGILYCLSADGKLLWTYDCGDMIRASVTVADINHDGKPEILVSSMNNRLTVLTGKGEKLFEFDLENPVAAPCAVLKGDKTLILIGDTAGILTAITPGQDTVWKLELKSKITTKPIELQGREEKRFLVGTDTGVLHCISEHGEPVWQYMTAGSITSPAVVADLDQDGMPEIVFGSCDNSVYALSAHGKRLWSYETDFWVTQSPVVTDLTGDGNIEVVAGSYDHNLYVLDGQGAYVPDYMPGISSIVHQAGHYSDVLTSEPGEQTGKKLFQYRLSDMITGIARLDDTIIATSKDGKVTALGFE